MTHCEVDYYVFFLHSSSGLCIYFVVYVIDIVVTGDDSDGIHQLKSHLQSQFQMKDLYPLKYFLCIEVAQSISGIVISQRKYSIEFLTRHLLDRAKPLSDPKRYRRLVGRLNYLIVTRLDITFVISVVRHFLNAPYNTPFF